MIGKPISMTEVKNTLKLFAKDKSPCPDGWMLGFFGHLFDLFGQEIYDAVEETRVQGKINEVLNSTYLTRIPKKNCPDTFNDFRHISLCSLLYKTVSKIIAEIFYG